MLCGISFTMIILFHGSLSLPQDRFVSFVRWHMEDFPFLLLCSLFFSFLFLQLQKSMVARRLCLLLSFYYPCQYCRGQVCKVMKLKTKPLSLLSLSSCYLFDCLQCHRVGLWGFFGALCFFKWGSFTFLNEVLLECIVEVDSIAIARKPSQTVKSLSLCKFLFVLYQ